MKDLEVVARAAADVVHTMDCLVPLFDCVVCLSFHVRDCSQPDGRKDQPHDATYCGSEHRAAVRVLAECLAFETVPA